MPHCQGNTLGFDSVDGHPLREDCELVLKRAVEREQHFRIMIPSKARKYVITS